MESPARMSQPDNLPFDVLLASAEKELDNIRPEDYMHNLTWRRDEAETHPLVSRVRDMLKPYMKYYDAEGNSRGYRSLFFEPVFQGLIGVSTAVYTSAFLYNGIPCLLGNLWFYAAMAGTEVLLGAVSLLPSYIYGRRARDAKEQLAELYGSDKIDEKVEMLGRVRGKFVQKFGPMRF